MKHWKDGEKNKEKKNKEMRRPGIEPGPRAWKARILTIELSTLPTNALFIVPIQDETEKDAKKKNVQNNQAFWLLLLFHL